MNRPFCLRVAPLLPLLWIVFAALPSQAANFCGRDANRGQAWNAQTSSFSQSPSNISGLAQSLGSGGNCAAIGSSHIWVWNGDTATWSDSGSIASLGTVVESDGYYAAESGSAVTVYDAETANWTAAQSVSGLSSVVASGGNFAAVGNDVVWIWNHVGGGWTEIQLSGLVEVIASAGNFAARNGSKVHAWSQIDRSVTASPSFSVIR
jgi:hypothetical protein